MVNASTKNKHVVAAVPEFMTAFTNFNSICLSY